MTDRAFLQWLHSRLMNVHGENPGCDHMLKLASIVESTPRDKCTPNTAPSTHYEKAGVTFEYKD